MLKECIEVFENQLAEAGEGEDLILDTYIPADGTYLIIDKNGQRQCTVEIKKDKKTKEIDRSSQNFPVICFYDYQSQLISMNKPMDGKKIIHSNNYLSFFVKKDSIVSGKLTDEVIDNYYETLKNPMQKKYKNSKEACKIYELYEKQEGKPDAERIEKIKAWIKANVYTLEDVDLGRKDYLKIFFEAEKDLYEKENRRYLLPNIYNSNDYNIEIEDVVYGLPDNNLGMNAKKPFLSIKTRKYPAPYLMNGEDVLIQKKFFDYLMNLVSAGKYHIYVDTENKKIEGYKNGSAPSCIEAGYYLRISKGKNEAEIVNQDNLSGYRRKLDIPFAFENMMNCRHERHPAYCDAYCNYYDRLDIGRLINEVLFSKWLETNYSTGAADINITDDNLKQNILLYRDTIFDWVYKGIDHGFAAVINKVSLNMAKSSVLKGLNDRALWQLNFRWSMQKYLEKGGNCDMAEIISSIRESVKRKVLSNTSSLLENDEEYYYAVGQLAAYLFSLSKAKDKNQSLLNPFLNAKTDVEIKKRLLQIYKKYNYTISDSSKRVKNLLVMIEGYVPESPVNQEMVICGYADDNLVYISKKEDK
ncbi:MAG: type I-B CRISPR-associated protein Cas8b/Csh1 [Clostridiales bacterium]|nr:type I-B CRISPR-associated protein Cas8b/Csh1 [Clostridiales bacterium]MDY3748096.1 type I-B CRISPR-associated protein Cas8b/Csh1 [Lachnospiraceae bacterium]